MGSNLNSPRCNRETLFLEVLMLDKILVSIPFKTRQPVNVSIKHLTFHPEQICPPKIIIVFLR